MAAYAGPVLLRFAHEMHDQSYPWAVAVNGNTAEQYVAAWRYVHAIFVAEGATNVRWIWNPNTMPGTARAAVASIALIRPRAIGLVTRNPKAGLFTGRSEA